MAARRLPKEVTAIFDKYIHNNVRHLKKHDAVQMLITEFKLEETEAAEIFDYFDRDQNGVMSLWEFQQFYQAAGQNAQEVVHKFHELDADGSGFLDADEARQGLKQIKTITGRPLEDKEIDFFIKSAGRDEDNMINLGDFVNLMFRLKLYKPPK